MGYPGAMNCPENISRRSMSFYYYLKGRPVGEPDKSLKKYSTIFVGRQGYNEDNITGKKESCGYNQQCMQPRGMF